MKICIIKQLVNFFSSTRPAPCLTRLSLTGRGTPEEMMVPDNRLPPWCSLAVFQLGALRGLNGADECSHTRWRCQTEEENRWDCNWHDGNMWGRGRGRLFMSYDDRKKERHRNVSGLVPHLQPHFWNKIHLILYGAGERKQSNILTRCCDSSRRLSLVSDTGSFFSSAAASDQNYDVLFSSKNCPTLLPPWGNVPFSVYWKRSFGTRAGISEVCSGGNLFVDNGKITGKGGEVIHIMSLHCWRKGVFQGCWKWNWWWRAHVTWYRFHYGGAGFQDATFVLQQRNVNVASIFVKGL